MDRSRGGAVPDVLLRSHALERLPPRLRGVGRRHRLEPEGRSGRHRRFAGRMGFGDDRLLLDREARRHDVPVVQREQLRRDRLRLRGSRVVVMRVEPYGAERRGEWNDFATRAKNGVFLFHRDYMEYHADRFDDASLLVFDDDALVALLPGNVRERTYVSHGGLTYGGFIVDARMRTATMLAVFEATLRHLAGRGIDEWIYKPLPHIYHSMPAEEDLYALFRAGAQ